MNEWSTPRMTLNSWPCCHAFPIVRITGMEHHTWLLANYLTLINFPPVKHKIIFPQRAFKIGKIFKFKSPLEKYYHRTHTQQMLIITLTVAFCIFASKSPLTLLCGYDMLTLTLYICTVCSCWLHRWILYAHNDFIHGYHVFILT